MDVCEELGIQLLWGVGGGKIQSSSTLVEDAGMVDNNSTDIIKPDRVEVVQCSRTKKPGEN